MGTIKAGEAALLKFLVQSGMIAGDVVQATAAELDAASALDWLGRKGLVDEEQVAQKLAGTDDYIGKPFARAELLARVRRLLERTYGGCLPRDTTAGASHLLDAPPQALAS